MQELFQALNPVKENRIPNIKTEENRIINKTCLLTPRLKTLRQNLK